MSREAHFLVAMARRFVSSHAASPDPTGVDWNDTLRLAMTHGVMPVMYRMRGAVPMPRDISEQLRAIAEADARSTLALSAELCRLAELLERHAIAFVPLKGPLLSQQLYGDVGARPPGDLDLLVHARDVVRARDLAVGLGYRVASPLHWPCDSACLKSREGQMVLVAERSSAVVDLHWRILPAYFASPFDRTDVWASLTRVRLAGREIPCLAPEHELLLLCAHGAKHAFERLGWICDLAGCLTAFANLDWSTIVSASARAGTTRQLLLGLRIAEDLLGAPLPLSLPEDPAIAPLIRAVRDRLFAAQPIPTPERELIPFCLRVLESPRHRLRYLCGHAAPSWTEYRAVALPPALYWAYYLLRPLRLTARSVVHRTEITG